MNRPPPDLKGAAGRRRRRGPTDGIVVLEKKLAAVYGLYGQAEHFRSVLYKDIGHEYLPEMKDEMVKWFERHLPVARRWVLSLVCRAHA